MILERRTKLPTLPAPHVRPSVKRNRATVRRPRSILVPCLSANLQTPRRRSWIAPLAVTSMMAGFRVNAASVRSMSRQSVSGSTSTKTGLHKQAEFAVASFVVRDDHLVSRLTSQASAANVRLTVPLTVTMQWDVPYNRDEDSNCRDLSCSMSHPPEHMNR
jgi:hypothetical protein